MELLGDMGQVESCFGLFRHGVSVGARFAPCVPYGQKSFWTHPMVLLGEEPQVEAHFWRVEMMLILTQDGCTVGAERTIGSENHFGRTRWNS